jgi:Cu+-exporting ATPase
MGASVERVELVLEGMSCAGCAGRIERALNAVDGVAASVNYATEKAAVDFDPARATPEALVAAVAAAGYGAHLPEAAPAERPDSALLVRLVPAAVLALAVVLIGMVPGLAFTGRVWVELALAAPVVLWAAWPFHRNTWQNLRHRTATMDTLISLGTLSAFGWSVAAAAAGGDTYFEAAAAVVAFLLTGRFLETRAKRRAGSALRALLEVGAKEAAVLEDGVERRVAVGELRPGALVVVRPGEKVATDGVVVEGRSAVDASLLTGESVPVEVGEGDEVVGGSVNVGGRILVRATRVGEETALAQIARLVSDAQTGKAPVQRLADRVAAVFVPAVVALALATLAAWLASGHSASAAVAAAVAVLIVACPCALGLATPTALLVGTGRGAQLGILIRGPEVLESTRRVDTIVLDKTGTVTTGRMELRSVAVAAGVDRAEALRLAGALEHASAHPVAHAVAAAAPGPLPQVAEFRSRDGLGVEGEVDGHAVSVGRPSLFALPEELEAAVEAAQRRGETAVVAAWDGEPRAVIAVADAVKPTSAEAVADLRRLGLRPVLLTGDNDRTARAVAAEIGVDEVIADVLPAEKSAVVRRLQEEGRVVAMVGDGVNDAPALARADLGLAIGTGADAAIEASDLTLVSGDLRAAADAIRLSRRTLATIKGNLFWAFAYNVAALPLAALGYLSPLVAGAAMAFSSVFVVTNSLRLRRFRPR